MAEEVEGAAAAAGPEPPHVPGPLEQKAALFHDSDSEDDLFGSFVARAYTQHQTRKTATKVSKAPKSVAKHAAPKKKKKRGTQNLLRKLYMSNFFGSDNDSDSSDSSESESSGIELDSELVDWTAYNDGSMAPEEYNESGKSKASAAKEPEPAAGPAPKEDDASQKKKIPDNDAKVIHELEKEIEEMINDGHFDEDGKRIWKHVLEAGINANKDNVNKQIQFLEKLRTDIAHTEVRPMESPKAAPAKSGKAAVPSPKAGSADKPITLPVVEGSVASAAVAPSSPKEHLDVKHNDDDEEPPPPADGDESESEELIKNQKEGQQEEKVAAKETNNELVNPAEFVAIQNLFDNIDSKKITTMKDIDSVSLLRHLRDQPSAGGAKKVKTLQFGQNNKFDKYAKTELKKANAWKRTGDCFIATVGDGKNKKFRIELPRNVDIPEIKSGDSLATVIRKINAYVIDKKGSDNDQVQKGMARIRHNLENLGIIENASQPAAASAVSEPSQPPESPKEAAEAKAEPESPKAAEPAPKPASSPIKKAYDYASGLASGLSGLISTAANRVRGRRTARASSAKQKKEDERLQNAVATVAKHLPGGVVTPQPNKRQSKRGKSSASAKKWAPA